MGNVVVWRALYVCIFGVVWWYNQASEYPAYSYCNSNLTWCHSRSCRPNLWWVCTFALGILSNGWHLLCWCISFQSRWPPGWTICAMSLVFTVPAFVFNHSIREVQVVCAEICLLGSPLGGYPTQLIASQGKCDLWQPCGVSHTVPLSMQGTYWWGYACICTGQGERKGKSV